MACKIVSQLNQSTKQKSININHSSISCDPSNAECERTEPMWKNIVNLPYFANLGEIDCQQHKGKNTLIRCDLI